MKIGVDYYPEHWDKSLWEKDADLMKKTGVKLVRLAEFSWCALEPADGQFDFAWLDEAIELFVERKINVVLCTPTSCPPLWFYEKYPDAVQTGKDGQKIATGIRGHRCYNNPDLIFYSKRIIDEMTKHYASNPAIAAWQIDNELEANYCFCDYCQSKYHSWLKNKYGDVKSINKAYGNNVWSGEYSSWNQIKPPYGEYPKAWLNPAYMLDYSRYSSDSMIDYVKLQEEIIRKNCPNVKITTNMWFCENLPDFYNEFKDLDFVAYDNYPTSKLPKNSEELYSHNFHLDFVRGIKKKNFWIMEQLSGGMGCWMPMQHTPRPGMIKGYSLQAFAHGADTVIHFRWRSAVTGAEMYWHGLIDHSNVPGRRFEEFSQLCEESKKLEEICETELKSKVAILYSPDNDFAFKIQPQTDGFYYLEQLMLIYSGFSKYGVNIDIINQNEDLSDYKIVVAPQMYITDKTVVDNLYKFAENGGTVVLTNRSGVKDQNNNCIMDLLPTVYKKLVGTYVEEYDPMGYDKICVEMDGDKYSCGRWCDVLAVDSENDGAEIVACYQETDDEKVYFAGKPAITMNKYGEGKAYYIGTVGEKKLYQKLAKQMLDECQIEYFDNLPDNVEVTTRSNDKEKAIFVFNNTEEMKTSCICDEEYKLEPFEMKIIRKSSEK